MNEALSHRHLGMLSIITCIQFYCFNLPCSLRIPVGRDVCKVSGVYLS